MFDSPPLFPVVLVVLVGLVVLVVLVVLVLGVRMIMNDAFLYSPFYIFYFSLSLQKYI